MSGLGWSDWLDLWDSFPRTQSLLASLSFCCGFAASPLAITNVVFTVKSKDRKSASRLLLLWVVGSGLSVVVALLLLLLLLLLLFVVVCCCCCCCCCCCSFLLREQLQPAVMLNLLVSFLTNNLHVTCKANTHSFPSFNATVSPLAFRCTDARGTGFNAPLAGILFAMEELQHVSSRLTTRVICIILIGSIVSTGVTWRQWPTKSNIQMYTCQ